jgi:hypothetical protein
MDPQIPDPGQRLEIPPETPYVGVTLVLGQPPQAPHARIVPFDTIADATNHAVAVAQKALENNYWIRTTVWVALNGQLEDLLVSLEVTPGKRPRSVQPGDL